MKRRSCSIFTTEYISVWCWQEGSQRARKYHGGSIKYGNGSSCHVREQNHDGSRRIGQNSSLYRINPHIYNGEIVFHIGTEQKQLYSLDTFPGEWTSLESFSILLRAIMMSAALQSLNLTDLSRFWITTEKRVICLTPTTGRVEMKIHCLELLHAEPEIGKRFRQAVCTDSVAFAAWIRSITTEK